MSIFSKIQRKKVDYNIFDLSHDRKYSAKFGELTPVYVQECVPGDKISVKASNLLRFAPLVSPVMHKISVYCHFFFVPNRILWDDWELFITGGVTGEAEPAFPTVPLKDFADEGGNTARIADYMGLPTNLDNQITTADTEVSILPFLAYGKIFNDYYRDQNLIQPVVDSVADFTDVSDFLMGARAWQHDYFTSALPWTQRGPEATLPLGTTAPIKYDGVGTMSIYDLATDTPVDASVSEIDLGSASASGNLQFTANEWSGATSAFFGPTSGNLDDPIPYSADLSEATASTIIELRRAFKLQEFLEINARGGSRYIENIKAHFGVNSSDKRLQRPEFLGGISSPVVISEVLQTSSNDTEPTPQGNMAGHGISVGTGGYVSKYCEEHGYIIGIMSVMPMSSYYHGVPRHFSKFDKFDYYWPSFAHIGEQAVYRRELFSDGSEANDEAVFGYNPRYSEYKYAPSTVHGDFKTTLDYWHMGRKMPTVNPLLNAGFITLAPGSPDDLERIFAVQDGSDYLWCQTLFNVKAQRKMPVFGNPGL